MPKPQIFRSVDIDSVELQLSRPETLESTVEEFYRFGTLLFSEIQQRGSEVDRKLTNMMGWSLATLGFILFDWHRSMQFMSSLGIGVLVTAATLSFACVLIAAFALKTRMWQAPSEKDWFKTELWSDPSRMKRYHVVSMLSTHQANVRHVAIKSDCLVYVEILLSISALAILNVLLFF